MADSTFKIPLLLNATSTCNLKPNTEEAKAFRHSKLIMWDKTPTMHVHTIQAADRLLHNLKSSEKYFEGEVILLAWTLASPTSINMRLKIS